MTSTLKALPPTALMFGGLTVAAIHPESIAAWLTSAGLIASAIVWLGRGVYRLHASTDRIEKIGSQVDDLCEMRQADSMAILDIRQDVSEIKSEMNTLQDRVTRVEVISKRGPRR